MEYALLIVNDTINILNYKTDYSLPCNSRLSYR